MFGTIVAPAPPPAPMTADEWAATVLAARLCMEISTVNTRTAIVACTLGYDDLESYHIALAADWRIKAYAATAEARNLFHQTAEGWKWLAEYAVKNKLARFAVDGCGHCSCDDCERPLWQHIVKADGDILCPFGREYWALARALMPSALGPDRSDDRAFLGAIASRQA